MMDGDNRKIRPYREWLDGSQRVVSEIHTSLNKNSPITKQLETGCQMFDELLYDDDDSQNDLHFEFRISRRTMILLVAVLQYCSISFTIQSITH